MGIEDIGQHRGITDGWAWATDGHVIVMRRGELPPGILPSDPGEVEPSKFVRQRLAESPAGEWASVATLRAFAGADCGGCTNGRQRCAACGGSGKRKDECPCCGLPHDCNCDCDEGTRECPMCSDPKYGRVLGVAINRLLLRKILRECPADRVRLVAGDTKEGSATMLGLVTEDWRAYQMAVRDCAKDVGDFRL